MGSYGIPEDAEQVLLKIVNGTPETDRGEGTGRKGRSDLKKGVTVICACRDPEKAGEEYMFPEQTFPREQTEVVRVPEDDVFHPWKRSAEQIERADRQYVILLDEEDLFEADFLQRMVTGLQGSGAAFGMPALLSNVAKRSQEYFCLKKIQETITIHTDYSQSVFPAELHGLLFETEKLQEAYRVCKGAVEPEKQILLYLLARNPSFLYFGGVSVRFGSFSECDYQYDIKSQMREWYFDSLEKFLLPLLMLEKREHGCVRPLYQYLAQYMLYIRIYANTDNRNKHVVEPEEMDAYTELFQEILQYVEIQTILDASSVTAFAAMRNRLLHIRLKKRDFSWYPQIKCTSEDVFLLCDDKRMASLQNNLPVNVYLIDYKDGRLEIDADISDFFHEEECRLYAKIGTRTYPVVYNRRFSSVKCFGVTYFRMKTFHVSVPIPADEKKRLLNFCLNVGGMEYRLPYTFPGHTSRFSKLFKYSYWHFGNYMAYWNGAGIHIDDITRGGVPKRELKLWLEMLRKKGIRSKKFLALRIVNFLLRPYFSRQKIWLFFDKIYKGGDSSEYLYRYAVKQNDGIRKYYLLDKNSADYKRMVKEGYRPLVRDSLKHRLIFLNADMVIASNSTVFAFNGYTGDLSPYIRGDVHFGVACVQHGMSVQKIALAQQRLRDNTKLYFCASKYEIENLSKPVYDYQGYGALHLTGVPRYDGLKDRAEKILLFSPTWRMQSAMPVTKNEGVARDYNPHFRETSYYRVYNGLLNDPRLLDAARTHGYRIQYVLHPIVSPQAEDFDKNDLVEIIPAIGDMSYEKIFCESALMVTDFSGVQFDFAYMRKPVVYLHHHDIPQHYEEGTYHYDTMSFGEICHTSDELIDVLIRYMENDCRMPELYRRRADDFFAYADHNNCERIYKVMTEYGK